MTRVIVVVPTYNERDNIRPLVEALIASSAEIRHDFEILVVDDNSPDGTQDVIHELQARHPNVRLLTGTKHGLGVAYARGIEYALSALHADIVLHMDADSSHNPADVPRLIAEIDAGHDLVRRLAIYPGRAPFRRLGHQQEAHLASRAISACASSPGLASSMTARAASVRTGRRYCDESISTQLPVDTQSSPTSRTTR